MCSHQSLSAIHAWTTSYMGACHTRLDHQLHGGLPYTAWTTSYMGSDYHTHLPWGPAIHTWTTPGPQATWGPAIHSWTTSYMGACHTRPGPPATWGLTTTPSPAQPSPAHLSSTPTTPPPRPLPELHVFVFMACSVEEGRGECVQCSAVLPCACMASYAYLLYGPSVMSHAYPRDESCIPA